VFELEGEEEVGEVMIASEKFKKKKRMTTMSSRKGERHTPRVVKEGLTQPEEGAT